jgi:hypothetical protein
VDDLNGHQTTDENRALMLDLAPHPLLQHKLQLLTPALQCGPQQTKLSVLSRLDRCPLFRLDKNKSLVYKNASEKRHISQYLSNKRNHFPDSQQNILDEQQSFQIRAWILTEHDDSASRNQTPWITSYMPLETVQLQGALVGHTLTLKGLCHQIRIT